MAPTFHPVNVILTPWISTLDGGVTPVATLSNPFPNGILQPPGHDPSFQSILLGQAISSPMANQRYAYVHQWNFTVQRQLAEGLSVEVAYAGSRGVHLLGSSQEVDQLPDQYLSLGAKLQQQVPNPFYGLIPSGGTLAGPTVAQGQLLRPIPEYSDVKVVGMANRNSIYHAMQMKLEKRFRSGGTILAAYTWSKIISDTDTLTTWLDGTGTTQNYNNLRAERSLLGTDVPQHLVVSYVRDLPFGRRQRFLGNVTGVADKLISGWGINGVSTFQSGFPLGLTTNVNLTNSFGGGSRPNVVYGCDSSVSGSAESRLNRWFNTSCFTQPPAFTFGNESRLDPVLRSAGINNWDLALMRNVRIRERLSLQFRGELYDAYNHPNYKNPNTTIGNVNFGRITSDNSPRITELTMRIFF